MNPPSNSSAGPVDSSVAEASLAAAWRRFGLRAKCAFLLRVIGEESSAVSDRVTALLALLDDVDELVLALTAPELAALRSVLTDALDPPIDDPSGQFWSTLALPDDETSAAEIDGNNVQRAVVGRTADEGLLLARVRIEGRGRFVVAHEYSMLSEGSAVIEIVDEATSTTISTSVLLPGQHRSAVCVVDASGPKVLLIRIVQLDDDSPVWWYGTSVHRVPDVVLPSASEFASSRVGELRNNEPGSVFAPVTNEPLTLRDIDRLTGLRDRFRGERVFIMGNGPSLNRTPLDLLDGEMVFGVNRVSLLFDRVNWRPTFFTAFDVRVVPDNREEFAALDVPYKFFSARYKSMMGERDNHYWYHTKGFYEGFEPAFEPTAVYSGFGGGGTIAVIAIEIAFYLGFRDIYLFGTDVSYSVPTTVKQSGDDVFGDGVKLELESTRDDDQNHFDPRYFGQGKKWHNPNVREMKIGFARAAAYVERRGGRLRNATVGGELDEVRRVDFESLF